ncbi:MAG: sulfotransferase, partial [Ectothiorhodospiraceae bacterium]
LGMHRSGTSMVARLLSELGLFLGWHKDVNHEAWFFLRLNEWLLRQCGGSWDNPEPVRHLLANPEGRRITAEYLRFVLASPRALQFLGPWRYLAQRNVATLAEPWGWKDPRTTYTAPLWLDLFPEARVIHVYRHGVDVAASLQRRQKRSTDDADRRFRRRRPIHAVLPKRGGFTESWRCADLDEALSLWSGYVSRARQVVAEHGDRALEVCYEDLLSAPQRELRRIAVFCGLDVDGDALVRAAGRPRASRALAYRADPGLCELAERWAGELRVHGY